MPTTVFDQFTRRTADITAQLAALGIPLTAPPPPPADPDPADPWASNYTAPVDRSSLAWCTAVTMLADHHHTGIDRQVLAADALLRNSGSAASPSSTLTSHAGAPVDYRFTRCPYCAGIGEDPTQPTCREAGCATWLEFADHDHPCPVCHGNSHQPQWYADEQMTELEKLLADAIEERESRASLRHRIQARLYHRTTRS
ncbi:hypothetical protein B590_30208 (plasmid) [Streptomyces sp. PVA_94-07]|uniref:hypothetical protein n=1 Tax=Streptomyces sp. PVA_94-07 TaxID=1225337 RepID=UPI0003C3068F|nr:hypothetical protein [Streptomyces sp. PVA_94-07]ESQ01745.1 hypothetical protein B590_30208 [Streptomyces sp. PVA_94-07]